MPSRKAQVMRCVINQSPASLALSARMEGRLTPDNGIEHQITPAVVTNTGTEEGHYGMCYSEISGK